MNKNVSKTKKIILIMGLPGSGKTFLARKLKKLLKADWLNADKVRGKYKDWDFSNKGILRQVKRMRKLATGSKKKFVVADFVCPLNIQLKIFKPDFIIWMDTIKKGRYEDMNKLFKAPKQYDLRIKEKKINESIKKFKKKFLHFEFTY
jgi:adenylylsulfate kinase